MAKVKLSKRSRSIVIGVVCGLLCVVCVGIYVAGVEARSNAAHAEMLAKYGGDQIEVCVAKRDIAAGETIREGDVEMRTWIATLLPANAVTNKKDAVGKHVGSTVLAGEVISSSRFGFDTASIDIPDGFVAISVPAREVQAVGGALTAGMTTDVYAVGGTTTSKIASSVQVLATSLKSDGSSSSQSAWVTIAVKPAIVQELVSAAESMELYFALPSESASSATPSGSSSSSSSSAQSSSSASQSTANEGGR